MVLSMKIIAIITVLVVVSASAVYLVNENSVTDDGSDDQDSDNQNEIPDNHENPDDIVNFTAKEPIETVFDLVNSSNDFTFDMYRHLANADENVFFSPYSITTAMGMAFEGARGETAVEMANVLNFTLDDEARWEIMMEFQNYFNNENASYNLSTANAFWLSQDGELREDYRSALISYYLAYGEELDFAGDPGGSADTINGWVENNTNGKIQDIISENDINALTYLILTNAIYFRANWKYQFDSNATENRTFYLSNGESVETETMHLHDEDIEFNYSSNSDVQMLQLPYMGSELSMYILLPKDNVSALESRLDSTYVSRLKDNLTSEDVNIYLPKFTFENQYELKNSLASMGMPGAFSSDANFSGITDSTSLHIDSVIHQSFIDVNEEGTEAAAATVVLMTFGVNSDQPISFTANHPFIFFIQHEETGQILFMGKLENPTA